MHQPLRLLLTLALVVLFSIAGLTAGQEDLLPPQLSQQQRTNLLSFLRQQEKPDRFLPPDARVADAPPNSPDLSKESKPSDKPVKQYMVQIISHRPVPGQEEVKQVDVYYYRPNPEKGKPGITVLHTVDVTTGRQVGPTQVLLNRHTPLSREERAEAVALAKEKSAPVQQLYRGREASTVHWEYLQMMIGRKHEVHEPGDRVARLVFMARDEKAPPPVAVIVNLTKGIVVADNR